MNRFKPWLPISFLLGLTTVTLIGACHPSAFKDVGGTYTLIDDKPGLAEASVLYSDSATPPPPGGNPTVPLSDVDARSRPVSGVIEIQQLSDTDSNHLHLKLTESAHGLTLDSNTVFGQSEGSFDGIPLFSTEYLNPSEKTHLSADCILETRIRVEGEFEGISDSDHPDRIKLRSTTATLIYPTDHPPTDPSQGPSPIAPAGCRAEMKLLLAKLKAGLSSGFKPIDAVYKAGLIDPARAENLSEIIVVVSQTGARS